MGSSVFNPCLILKKSWHVILIFLLLLVLIKDNFSIALNETDSMNGTAFLLVHGRYSVSDFHKNDLVAFKLRSHCSDFSFLEDVNDGQVLKIVSGLPGDRVEKIGNDFFVDGAHFGFAKLFSRKDVPLSPSSLSGEIPAHYFYASAPSIDSFDSRYACIGLIHDSQIFAKAYKLF
jgi:hypothetical protein